jgi:hypothetical protein
MASGKWKLYESAKEYIGDGTVDLDGHSFKIALFTSSSNANDLTQSTFAGLTNQHAGGTGYTYGGATLTTVTWNRSGGTVTFDADNVEWTASGGAITAMFAVIYDDTAASDELICVCLLENPAANVTAADGTKFQVNFNASGIFNVSGATSD